MSANRDESFLTVAEVADWLKVNQQTVRNWIDQGKLPAVRVGRRVRIKRSDFDRIMGGAPGGQKPPTGTARSGRPAGPSAEDFWSGEQVGMAEPDPSAEPGPSTDPNRTPGSERNRQSGHRTENEAQEPRRSASR